jgi:hypothetical protein
VNAFLPSIFDERVYRLALGLEPLDAITAGRISQPVDVTLDGPPVVPPHTPPWPEPSAASGLFALPRHGSGRFVLLFDSKVDTPVSLRLVPADRRYVPRRMTFAFVDETTVLADEEANMDLPTWNRAWRPLLFPGAAYDVEQTATGVRGTVTSGGQPVRWTRVEASIAGTVIGRAHGDDRGEFLLVLGPNTDVSGTGDLVSPTDVTIDVYARNPALPQDPADPLADLPLETAAAPGVTPDDVSDGVNHPDHYVQVASLVDHPVILGRLSSLPIAV